MMSNEEIYKILEEKRDERNKLKPDSSKLKNRTLSGSSLKKYSSVIRSLYAQLQIEEPLKTPTFLKNIKTP